MRYSAYLVAILAAVATISATPLAGKDDDKDETIYTCNDAIVSKGKHMCKMWKVSSCKHLNCGPGYLPMYYKSMTDHGGWLCCKP